MIGLAAWTRIWIVGVTDMRRGFVGLAGMVVSGTPTPTHSPSLVRLEFLHRRMHLFRDSQP